MKSLGIAVSICGLLAAAGCSETPVETRTMRCTDGPTATFHFPDPETLELRVDGGTHILTRQRTASGARYAGDGIDFWNKGEEVMLTLGERRYTCLVNG